MQTSFVGLSSRSDVHSSARFEATVSVGGGGGREREKEVRRGKKRHSEEKRSLEKKKASPPSVVPKEKISAFASPSFVIDLT